MEQLNSNELLDLLGMVSVRIMECEEALQNLITQESHTIVNKRILELTNIKTKLTIQLKNK